MKKNILILVFILFLTSCSFIGDNKKELENTKRNSLQSNISSGLIVDNNFKNRSGYKLEELGDTTEEILDSFYSNDPNKQKIIKEWLSDPKNARSSEKGDIIEFLDYCEKFKNEVKDINTFNKFLYLNSRDEYIDTMKSNEILENNVFKEKIEKLLSNKVDNDGIQKYYFNLFEKFLNGKEINCRILIKGKDIQ